jgi:hypothetical protein
VAGKGQFNRFSGFFRRRLRLAGIEAPDLGDIQAFAA